MCIKIVHKYGKTAKDSCAGVAPEYLLPPSKRCVLAPIKVSSFICCEYKCLCCAFVQDLS